MLITRRKFINTGMIGLGFLSMPEAFFPAFSASDALARPAADYESAFAFLNRISFGATITDCQSLMQMGITKYVEAQLRPAEGADAVCTGKIAAAMLHIEYKENQKKQDAKKPDDKKNADKNPAEEMQMVSYPAVSEDRPLSCLEKPLEELWKLADNSSFMDGRERTRPVQEVRAATWIRAVHSRWQLREIMVEFWHNHFNVQAFGQQQISATFPLYDKIMRRNCFGNFRQLLEEVAQSPAMLFYLNNAKSKASPANENYARELFELHTLGASHYYNNLYNRWREVPGATQQHPIGYIDQDVYEAARAFTGWTIEDGSNTGRGTIFPNTGKFVYFDGWHDNYQKRVLGNEFDPNAPPMADGKKVLDIVAAHPGTAMFLCTKLCRRFSGDNPSQGLVKKAAAVWQKNLHKPDQIAQVLRTILLSPEVTEAKDQKIKRPFEYVVSFLRATGGDITPNEALFGTMSGTGYRQFEWATPTGHPDVANFWLNTNTTLSSWNFLPALFSPNFKAASFDLAQQTPSSIRTSQQIVSYWFMRLTGKSPNQEMIAELMQYMPEPHNPEFVPDIRQPGFKQPLQEMVMTIAMLPQFSVRG